MNVANGICRIAECEIAKEAMMRIAINAEKCIGCARCAYVSPLLYVMDHEKAVARSTYIPAELKGYCDAAIRACPSNAISLAEDRLLLTQV
ncbi:MAG: ferredoxin [Candidatus Aureabacteria bacterium]|nr:ferredoxin [Candidatus Auribacterota bacterium]